MLWRINIWSWRIRRWRKDRQEIKALRKAIIQVEKEYAPRFAAAEIGGDEMLIDDYLEAISPYQPKLDYLKTQRLIEKAAEIGFEIPSDGDRWFIQQYDCCMERSYKTLSRFGEIKLRDMIRKQKRENFEWWVTKVIVPVIGAITGLMGVILAFYALRNK